MEGARPGCAILISEWVNEQQLSDIHDLGVLRREIQLHLLTNDGNIGLLYKLFHDLLDDLQMSRDEEHTDPTTETEPSVTETGISREPTPVIADHRVLSHFWA